MEFEKNPGKRMGHEWQWVGVWVDEWMKIGMNLE